jgi:hypothetical protein
VVETPWSARRVAVLVASERLTDEPWIEIPERTLLRVDFGPQPTLHTLYAPASSTPELAGIARG